MTDVVKIFDTTLRDGEQSPGCSMNLTEKIQVAKQLEKLGVDVIEAGFPIASPGDFESVKAVAGELKNCTIAGLSRALKKDIDSAYEALKNAASPRIHTFIATSDIHLKYKLKMSHDEVINQTAEMVGYAHNLCGEVEFSCEDATRTNKNFIYKVIETAIKNGASVINIPDTVGYTMPDEYINLITDIRNNVSNIDKAILSVHCHNDLGMSVANSLAAVKAGVRQVECTINGIGERAGNAALEEIVMGLKTRKDIYKVETNINTQEIYNTSNLVISTTGSEIQANKAIVGRNAFAHEAGIHQHGVLSNRETYEIMTPESIGLSENVMVLGKHSGKHAFKDRIKSLGFTLSDEDITDAFIEFKKLCDKKKDIADGDIEALVEQRISQVPENYHFEKFVINSGNTITSTAVVTLSKNDKIHEEVSTGDGPIDASFNAMDKICGIKTKLDTYKINSVSGGKDAIGSVSLTLIIDNDYYKGRGWSTDIVEASITAYLNAVNKMFAHKNK